MDYLDEADREHWDGLRAALDALGTPYVVEPTLVRGLDYYSRTAFEIRSTAGELGSQNTLAGGGRYDAMIQSLGGPDVPAIGFAMGIERILLALGEQTLEKPALCYIAPIGRRATEAGLGLAQRLRARDVRTELDGRGGSLKSMLRRADALGARLAIVIGDSEIERGVVQLKDLAQHSQEELLLEAVVDHVSERLRSVEAAR